MLLPGIVMSGLIVFFECLRVELILHRPTKRRTFDSASGPGIVLTCPWRTSSRRRLASVAQSLSMRLPSAAFPLTGTFSRTRRFRRHRVWHQALDSNSNKGLAEIKREDQPFLFGTKRCSNSQ